MKPHGAIDEQRVICEHVDMGHSSSGVALVYGSRESQQKVAAIIWGRVSLEFVWECCEMALRVEIEFRSRVVVTDGQSACF